MDLRRYRVGNRLKRADTASSAIGAIALLALVACSSDPENPSADSELLQKQVIPAMIQWGQGQSAVMDLAPFLSGRFGLICTVPEYEPLSSLRKEIPNVTEFRGSVGDVVPETRIAIIGVSGNTAHVAYVKYSILAVRNRGRRCSESGRAKLIRVPNAQRVIPNAILE